MRLEALAERQQARMFDAAERLVGTEPAHAPPAVGIARLQLARPRRVPLHGPPHQLPHIELLHALANLAPLPVGLVSALRIYTTIVQMYLLYVVKQAVTSRHRREANGDVS